MIISSKLDTEGTNYSSSLGGVGGGYGLQEGNGCGGRTNLVMGIPLINVNMYLKYYCKRYVSQYGQNKT